MASFSVVSEWAHGTMQKATERTLSLRAVGAELIGMTFFVLVGCGTAVSFSTPRASSYAAGAADSTNVTEAIDNSKLLSSLQDSITINSSFGVATALAFGFAIMVLIYGLGHISGGHFNPAVTLSLFLSGHLSLIQGIANVCAQVVGSILAASILYGMTPNASASSLGANSIAPGFSGAEAMLGEIFMTALLCFTVHMTCCDPSNDSNKLLAPLAIGVSVALAHFVMIPIDGCSINPARSLGPAIISGEWASFWVFIVGPFVGSFLGVALWLVIAKEWTNENAIQTDEENILDTNGTDASPAAKAVV